MAPGREVDVREDILFDRFLPDAYRRDYFNFWTPLAVAAQVALWLDEFHIETVVDIGSGVGKFCIGAALASRSSFVGIEQRHALVSIARGIARELDLERRVRFVEGEFGEVTVPAAHCYYFFNPFGEGLLGDDERLDDTTDVSEAKALRDIYWAAQLLEAAKTGTYVITYNGFGGMLPRSYQVVRSDSTFRCALYLARRR